jgi:hypothetical protein
VFPRDNLRVNPQCSQVFSRPLSPVDSPRCNRLCSRHLIRLLLGPVVARLQARVSTQPRAIPPSRE